MQMYLPGPAFQASLDLAQSAPADPGVILATEGCKSMGVAMLFAPTADHQDGFIGQLGERWRAWRERRDSLAALDGCGRSEMGRIARDLSLSTSELRAIVGRGRGSTNLLYRRMDDLGLNRDMVRRGEPSRLRDMQKVCSLCANKGRCKHDLARGAEAAAWNPYCPNDDTLGALVAGGAHGIRRVSTGAANAATVDDAWRDMHSSGPEPLLFVVVWLASTLGLLLIVLLSVVIFATPPAVQHSDVRGLAPVAPREMVSSPAPALDCLDAGCLSAPQLSALRDLHAVRSQGWIASSAAQLAALPRVSSIAQGVQTGEAVACGRAGGTTYYGFMFQGGCTRGGTEAAKVEGFNECRPMAGGGACLLR